MLGLFIEYRINKELRRIVTEMSQQPETNVPSPTVQQVKGDARDNRLTAGRKHIEEVWRKELLNESFKKCDSDLKAFAECKGANGFLVIFACREQNRKSMLLFYHIDSSAIVLTSVLLLSELLYGPILHR